MERRSLVLSGHRTSHGRSTETSSQSMSTDPRAASSSVPVSSQKQCCACPVEGSSLCQLMCVFSFFLVTVQVRTVFRRSAYRSPNSALGVQCHFLISFVGPCRSLSATSSVRFHSPTSFPCFRLVLAGCEHICLLAACSRFGSFCQCSSFQSEQRHRLSARARRSAPLQNRHGQCGDRRQERVTGRRDRTTGSGGHCRSTTRVESWPPD